MSEEPAIPNIDFESINRSIADRTNVFYWQTDRTLTPEQSLELFWSGRHESISYEELHEAVVKALPGRHVEFPVEDADHQNKLGNVNIVQNVIVDGVEHIIRTHPRNLQNGYFHAEAEIAKRVKANGLNGFDTVVVADLGDVSDFAFIVVEKLQGINGAKLLELDPDANETIAFNMGATMAKLHQLDIIDSGFGPLDNEQARTGKLAGIHDTYKEHITASLQSNVDLLVEREVITAHQDV